MPSCSSRSSDRRRCARRNATSWRPEKSRPSTSKPDPSCWSRSNSSPSDGYSMSELTPQQWLLSHVNLEAGLGTPRSVRERGAPTLDRIGGLLTYFGSPELEYPAIQITGTNGKTTTAHIITTLLTHFGI